MTVKELYEYAKQRGCEDTEIGVDAKSIADEYIASTETEENRDKWGSMTSEELLRHKSQNVYGDLECAAYGDCVVLGYHDTCQNPWLQTV